jgi:hypothetical protein
MGQLAGVRYEFFHKGYLYGTRRMKTLVNNLITKAHDDISDEQANPKKYVLHGAEYVNARYNTLLMEIMGLIIQ